jgi:hypothetical protein
MILGSRPAGGSGGEPGFFARMFGMVPPKPAAGGVRTTPMRIEPKTFFANERTFLAWLHMAVTLGSVSAALLGFAGGEESDPGEQARPSGLAAFAHGLETQSPGLHGVRWVCYSCQGRQKSGVIQ